VSLLPTTWAAALSHPLVCQDVHCSIPAVLLEHVHQNTPHPQWSFGRSINESVK
jgi:hypothetical protein